MPTVTVTVTEAQYAALEQEAKARGTSKSSIVREALSLKEVSPLVKGGSAFDLIADLVGSIEGPSDLATNPAYLRDYGKSRSARRKL